MSCAAKIAGEIAARGPIPFSRFMEIALYDPECGYYAAERPRIGRSGDYLTSVSAGAAFGRIIALQLVEMWEVLGSPTRFTLVEQGANDGSLAADILSAPMPESFAQALDLHIVEPLTVLRSRQSARLARWRNRVTWFSSMEEMPKFVGTHLSNELVDALPFEILRHDGSAWRMQQVMDGNGRFVFCDGSACPEAGYPVRAPGTLAEYRPTANAWIQSVAERLDRGFLLLFDYGMPRSALLEESRSQGTHVAICHHRQNENLLENPGGQDLTAHVDFSALAIAGRAARLQGVGFTDQHHFLVGAAASLLRAMESARSLPADTTQFLQAFKMLMHPEALGVRYQAFCMAAGFPVPPQLSGFASGVRSFEGVLP